MAAVDGGVGLVGVLDEEPVRLVEVLSRECRPMFV